MILKKAFQNITFTLPIIVISNIIYVIYISQFPGGVTGMLPFILIKNSTISLLISFAVYVVILIKFKLNFLKSSLIFMLVSFLNLYMFYDINPFKEVINENERNLEIWYYISIFIATLIMVIGNKLKLKNGL